jgi:hypothetical protein
MRSPSSIYGVGPSPSCRELKAAGPAPAPSDAVLIRLAAIAAHVDELLAADQPTKKAPAGLTTVKNDRRRTMEAILLLLADPGVRDYLVELKRLGLVPLKG